MGGDEGLLREMGQLGRGWRNHPFKANIIKYYIVGKPRNIKELFEWDRKAKGCQSVGMKHVEIAMH